MAQLRLFAIIGMAIMTFVLISTIPIAASPATIFLISPESSEPDIWAWGIEGEYELGQGFDVWANVSDQDDDLKNVTVQVIGPNMTYRSLMTFNGSFYIDSVPAFPNDGTFTVRLRAYDFENNTRTSSPFYIDYISTPPPIIDPSITLPIVVGSSVGLMVVLVGFAYIYDRKKGPEESVITQE